MPFALRNRHSHQAQEEIYVVVRASGPIKIDDEVGAPSLGEDPREDVSGSRRWWAQ